jgi:hypothetical protein
VIPTRALSALGVAAVVALASACAEEGAPASAERVVEQSPQTRQASPSPTPSFPPQADAEHGAKQTARLPRGGLHADDPKLEAGQGAGRERSATTTSGVGDIGCDQGRPRGADLDPDRDYVHAALYFADRAAAQQFVDAYEPGVVGTADVTTYCLD